MPFKSSSSFLLLLFLLPLLLLSSGHPLSLQLVYSLLTFVTRWTLTAQPALTMCLLDTAACGTLAPRLPRVPWAPELCLCWTVRSSLWRRKGSRGVKRLFVCLKKEKRIWRSRRNTVDHPNIQIQVPEGHAGEYSPCSPAFKQNPLSAYWEWPFIFPKRIHKKKKNPICSKLVDEVLDTRRFPTKNQLT